MASNLPQGNLKPAFQMQISAEEKFKICKYFESVNEKREQVRGTIWRLLLHYILLKVSTIQLFISENGRLMMGGS